MTPHILTSIADNPLLLTALQEVLERQFEPETKRSDDTITDIQLGQMYRARLVGLQKIEEAMKEIRSHRTPITVEPMGRNPAR